MGQVSDTLKITDITLDSKGRLKWTYHFAGDSINQIVESFENNEWKILCSISTRTLFGLGAKEGRMNESVRIKLHTGRNIIRIRVTSPYATTSKEIEVYNNEPDIDDFNPIVVEYGLTFSEPISFQFYNRHHKSVLKGYGINADLTALRPGTYYLQTDTIKHWKKIVKIKKNRKGTSANSTYKKLSPQWLNQNLYFNKCLGLVESEELRNRQPLVAANRQALKNFVFQSFSTNRVYTILCDSILDRFEAPPYSIPSPQNPAA